MNTILNISKNSQSTVNPPLTFKKKVNQKFQALGDGLVAMGQAIASIAKAIFMGGFKLITFQGSATLKKHFSQAGFEMKMSFGHLLSIVWRSKGQQIVQQGQQKQAQKNPTKANEDSSPQVSDVVISQKLEELKKLETTSPDKHSEAINTLLKDAHTGDALSKATLEKMDHFELPTTQSELRSFCIGQSDAVFILSHEITDSVFKELISKSEQLKDLSFNSDATRNWKIEKCALPNLTTLAVEGDITWEEIENILDGSPNLNSLDIESNEITKDQLKTIATKYPQLKSLTVNLDNINHKDFTAVLKKLKNLKSLTVKGLKIPKNEEFEKITLPQLQTFRCTECDIEAGPGFYHLIESAENLQHLSLKSVKMDLVPFFNCIDKSRHSLLTLNMPTFVDINNEIIVKALYRGNNGNVFPKLKFLDTSGSGIKGTALSILCATETLIRLKLGKSINEDELLALDTPPKKLKWVKINAENFSGRGLNFLKDSKDTVINLEIEVDDMSEEELKKIPFSFTKLKTIKIKIGANCKLSPAAFRWLKESSSTLKHIHVKSGEEKRADLIEAIKTQIVTKSLNNV